MVLALMWIPAASRRAVDGPTSASVRRQSSCASVTAEVPRSRREWTS